MDELSTALENLSTADAVVHPDCQICYSEPEIPADVACASRHPLCTSCLRSYLEGCISAGKVEPSCPVPGCETVIGTSTLLALLPPEAVENYKAFLATHQRPMERLKPVVGLVEHFRKLAHEEKVDAYHAAATDFYHYNCNDELDAGWGCAYRCLQSIISSLQYLGHELVLPSLADIQHRLTELKYQDTDYRNSTKWIEPHHARAYLEHHHVKSVYKDYSQTDSYALLEADLWAHFQSQHPMPVMIDNGLKAFVIAGVRRRMADGTTTTEVLRFDPHIQLLHSQTVEDFTNGRGKGAEWLPFTALFNGSTRWMVLYTDAYRHATQEEAHAAQAATSDV